MDAFRQGTIDFEQAVQAGNLFASLYIKAPLGDRYGNIRTYPKMLQVLRTKVVSQFRSPAKGVGLRKWSDIEWRRRSRNSAGRTMWAITRRSAASKPRCSTTDWVEDSDRLGQHGLGPSLQGRD